MPPASSLITIACEDTSRVPLTYRRQRRSETDRAREQNDHRARSRFVSNDIAKPTTLSIAPSRHAPIIIPSTELAICPTVAAGTVKRAMARMRPSAELFAGDRADIRCAPGPECSSATMQGR